MVLWAVASAPRRSSLGERGRESRGSEEAERRCGEVASSGATRRGWSGRRGRSSSRCGELRRSERRWRWSVSSAARVDGEGVALRSCDHAERMAVGEGGGGAGAGGAKVADSRTSARGAAAAGGGRLVGVAMAGGPGGFGLELETDTTRTTDDLTAALQACDLRRLQRKQRAAS